MSEVKVTLTANVARAILNDIADANTGKSYASNKGWAWWAYDARDDVSYPFGDGSVQVVQRPGGLGEWSEKEEGDTEVVFEFLTDDMDEPVFFRVTGEYTSYNGDTWQEGSFRQVRPTKIVKRLYQAV